MKIDEAIKHLSTINGMLPALLHTQEQVDRYQNATKLGIEALERVQMSRDKRLFPMPSKQQLPGETI